MIRTTATAAARTSRRTPPQPHFVRAFAATALSRKDPGEGVGKKEPVGGDNPVSARAKGVASGLKSAVEGAIGIGQAATGEQSSLGAGKKHPGPDTRDSLHALKDKGKEEGLAHKGKQQGAI
ncbi:hypothetical protein JCM3770_004005 [Rhodotorula araucariae]